MSADALSPYRPEFDQVVDFLKNDITTLRTGRATPQLVENIMVEAYGAKTAMLGVASISVPDARTVIIEPWDKGLLKEIERGIQESKLGINPVIQGQVVRLSLPALTEENRKNLVKMLGEKLEQARVGVRAVREKAKADIIKAEKDKDISEDDKFKYLEELDKMAAGFNERIKHVGDEKEKEVMTM